MNVNRDDILKAVTDLRAAADHLEQAEFPDEVREVADTAETVAAYLRELFPN